MGERETEGDIRRERNGGEKDKQTGKQRGRSRSTEGDDRKRQGKIQKKTDLLHTHCHAGGIHAGCGKRQNKPFYYVFNSSTLDFNSEKKHFRKKFAKRKTFREDFLYILNFSPIF